jgi:hypothetical protein
MGRNPVPTYGHYSLQHALPISGVPGEVDMKEEWEEILLKRVVIICRTGVVPFIFHFSLTWSS